MTQGYARPPEVGDGLRLHLNENTGGCSPAVAAALGRLDPSRIATYPAYRQVQERAAAHLGVAPDQLLLTNGLDEGILATSIVTLRDRAVRPEAVLVEPTFEMYAICAKAMDAPVVAVQPRDDFSFPIDELLGALTPATRVVFLTSPGNPTGQLIPRSAIERVLERTAGRALVLLDEAYADFAGETLLPELPRYPNLLIGRTFAKSYGLAGLRVGALVGAPPVLDPIRAVVPPFSFNTAAVAALDAALGDPHHVQAYLEEVAASKALIYETCERLGLTCWRSSANFVLIRVGDALDRVLADLRERRIFVRNRSADPGCRGCLRVTAGVVADTRRFLDALEEAL